MSTTPIQWTRPPGWAKGMSWNMMRGCGKVAPGCKNCYAEKIAARFSGPGLPFEGVIEDGHWNGKVEFAEHKLLEPLHWKTGRVVFVDSMFDLFHPGVELDWIIKVYAVMAMCPQLQFIILTKRGERMVEILNDPEITRKIWMSAHGFLGGTKYDVYKLLLPKEPGAGLKGCDLRNWPLPNVAVGVSISDQATADDQIPHLLNTPAACRIVSCEPMLGEVDYSRIGGDQFGHGRRDALNGLLYNNYGTDSDGGIEWLPAKINKIDWLIVGAESGPGARPLEMAWVRSAMAQCAAAGVRIFVKQLGPGLAKSMGLKSKKGDDPEEWPEDLRQCRQFPDGWAR